MFYFQAEVEFICSYYSCILIHREICVCFAANKLQFNVFVCIQLHCSYNTEITVSRSAKQWLRNIQVFLTGPHITLLIIARCVPPLTSR